MKKSQRLPWLGISVADLEEPGVSPILCSECVYFEISHFDEEYELDCEHPLDIVRFGPPSESAWTGGDCWGFRNKSKLKDRLAAYSLTREEAVKLHEEYEAEQDRRIKKWARQQEQERLEWEVLVEQARREGFPDDL